MIPADVAAQDISYALERAILVSFDELSRQLGRQASLEFIGIAISLLSLYCIYLS